MSKKAAKSAKKAAPKKDASAPGVEAASKKIDGRISELGDWRGEALEKVRRLIKEADPEIVEEWKWVKPSNPGTPVWSHNGITCTGETYKDKVKLTFAKGASLPDPSGVFNSSLEGNTRRAIDVHEGDTINEEALQALIRAAVALNTSVRATARPVRSPKRPKSVSRAGREKAIGEAVRVLVERPLAAHPPGDRHQAGKAT